MSIWEKNAVIAVHPSELLHSSFPFSSPLSQTLSFSTLSPSRLARWPKYRIRCFTTALKSVSLSPVIIHKTNKVPTTSLEYFGNHSLYLPIQGPYSYFWSYLEMRYVLYCIVLYCIVLYCIVLYKLYTWIAKRVLSALQCYLIFPIFPSSPYHRLIKAISQH